MMNIAIVDDEVLIVELLKEFFDRYKDIKVILTANSGEEFIKKINLENNLPDILFLDLKMKDLSGIEVSEYLCKNYPDIKIIVMSSLYKISFMGFMLKTGVAAFIPKGLAPSKILDVALEVHKNGYYFMPEQMDVVRKQISKKAPRPVVKTEHILSPREKDILKLLCSQKTASQIAEILFINKRTVEGHKTHIYEKTGAKNLAGLVVYAVQNKLVDCEEIILV